jgi:hypothetical protein
LDYLTQINKEIVMPQEFLVRVLRPQLEMGVTSTILGILLIRPQFENGTSLRKKCATTISHKGLRLQVEMGVTSTILLRITIRIPI